MNIDPLAEKYLNVSPYNYTLNNPIVFVDPNGMETFYNASISFTRSGIRVSGQTERGNDGGGKLTTVDVFVMHRVDRTKSGEKTEEGSDVIYMAKETSEKNEKNQIVHKNIYLTASINYKGELSTIQIQAVHTTYDKEGEVVSSETAADEVSVKSINPKPSDKSDIANYLRVVEGVRQYRGETGLYLVEGLLSSKDS